MKLHRFDMEFLSEVLHSKKISSLVSCCLFFVLLSANYPLSASTDTIHPGESLNGNQTLISKEGNFALGFFSPGKSGKFYIGIWYNKIPKQTVIWVANRDKPVYSTSSAELKLSENGHLVLLDNFLNFIWSSNSTQNISNTTEAVLLDNGNLILRDVVNNSIITWQSFDHPTDTYVPGSWIGMNKITGEYQSLTSWKNSEDPSPGYFSETIDPNGTSEFFIEWNRSVKYWRSGLWTGHYFAAVPILPEMKPHTIIIIDYVDNKERRCTTSRYRDPSSGKITRQVVDVTGQIKQFVWMDSAQDWALFFSRPVFKCDVHSLCGPFGICNEKSFPICSCPQGFEQSSSRDWELNDWSSGCTRKTRLQCGRNNKVEIGFLVMPNMLLPSTFNHIDDYSLDDCKSSCLSDCSCSAYAHNGSGCLIWNEELRNLQQLYDSDDRAQTLYVRLAASDLPSSGNDNKKIILVILICVAVIAVLGAALLFLALRYRRRRRSSIANKWATEGSLIRFTYAELQNMTNDFSEKLGDGGFGSVFKGALPDGTEIAVKKLEGLGQGEKQFRTEVSTLGSIQHINLIRLRGFCSEGNEVKLLVYDFMQNGSLNTHLFEKTSKALSWRDRYKIILGISRGLAYLHDNCRERIIHCDIKPENILLDEKKCPKLADFGMAKLIGRDFSRVLTTMRGTIGYLAPEWISGLPITTKADVYSFGMVLFEIISGRRNISHPVEFPFFPAWAAARVSEGEVLVLLDERLEGDAAMEELVAVSRIASWCIQDNEAHRPSMGQIVQILENAAEVNVPPVPESLQVISQDKDSETDVYFSAILSLS